MPKFPQFYFYIKELLITVVENRCWTYIIEGKDAMLCVFGDASIASLQQ